MTVQPSTSYIPVLASSRYTSSDGNSHPGSPSESEASEVPKAKEHVLNPKHLKCLAKNNIDFDIALCQNIQKPPLQLLYRWYCVVNNIIRQVHKLRGDKTWKGAKITKTEIISLFVAKSTWHESYRMQMPAAETQEQMRAWLTGEKDGPSDADIWGDVQDYYSLKDLDGWLEQKLGKKKQVVKKAMGKDIVKGKAKVDASQGTGQGKSSEAEKQVQAKAKAKVVAPKAAKAHKKKSTTG
jgi:hypothetical protein